MTTDALPRAVAIVGPTAAGKSALAISLAQALELPILCCDSVQVYRGLDIGSAKPSAADRARADHRLLDLVDPDESFSSGQYAARALSELARGPAIICGGTGLYLRATVSTHSSDIDEAALAQTQARSSDHADARASFESEWLEREASEPGAIHRELSRRDPTTAAQIHPNNVIRALRAVWLCETHGEPISAVRQRNPPRPRVELMVVVLDPGVAVVDAAINRRCEAMLARGWLAEVEKLVAAGYDARCKAMRSLGYRELLETVAGRSTLEQAQSAIERATRDYARRQRTYFRHQFRDLVPMERIVHIEHPEACPAARIQSFLRGCP